MVCFEKICVGKDYLDISVAISDKPEFMNMYIEQLAVDTHETYVSTGPSVKAAYSKNYENFRDIYREEFKDASEAVRAKYITRRVDIRLNKADLGVDDIPSKVYMVHVKVGGVPGRTLDCGEDKVYHLGLAYSREKLYSEFVRLVPSELSEDNSKAIDAYLRAKVIDSSFKSGRIDVGIQYWKDFFTAVTKGKKERCSCDDSK